MKDSMIPLKNKRRQKRKKTKLEIKFSPEPGTKQTSGTANSLPMPSAPLLPPSPRQIPNPISVTPISPTGSPPKSPLKQLLDHLPSNLMPNLEGTIDMDTEAGQENGENKTNKAFLGMSPVLIRVKNKLRQLIVKDAINEIQNLGEGETRLVSNKVNRETGKMKSNAFSNMAELRRYKSLFEVKRMLYELEKRLNLENYTKLGVGSRHMERKVLHARMKEFVAQMADLLEAMQNLKGTERMHQDFVKQKWDENFY